MSWLASLIISGFILSNFGADAPSIHTIHTDRTITGDTQTTGGEETENFAQTYPFNSNGSVALSNINGSVTIETWDRNEVKVEYTKTGTDKEILSMVDVRIDASRDRIEIEANYDKWKGDHSRDWEKWKGRKASVTFKLTVPRTAVLNEIETVNGSIVLSNLTNSCKISTVNGQVSARNIRGNANLSTVNGIVEADFDRLDGTSQISMSTVNGKALLTIPSDSDATVKADTVNGSITNDFGLPVRKGRYVGRDLYGRLGSGQAKIRLSSVNGGLAVSRKQDGKTPNPATNLLNMKEDNDIDDDDDKDDEDEIVARASMNRDVERAVRDAVRSVPVVVSEATADLVISKEMLKEVAKAQRDIARATNSSTVALNRQAEAALRVQQRQLAGLRALSGTGSMPVVNRQSNTFTVKGTPKVTIEARNCSVVVRGWDKSEVQYSLTSFSRVVAPQEKDVVTESDDSKVKIKVSSGNALNRYRLEVFVPQKSNLKITTDREIRLEGVAGELELSSGSEAINVRDSEGKLTVATVDGKVRVVGFHGEVNSTTAMGTISLEGEFTKLSANAGDGILVLTLPENAGAYIATNSENISAEGLSLSKEDDMWKVGKGGDTYRILTTSEGKVIVRSSAQLRAAF